MLKKVRNIFPFPTERIYDEKIRHLFLSITPFTFKTLSSSFIPILSPFLGHSSSIYSIYLFSLFLPSPSAFCLYCSELLSLSLLLQQYSIATVTKTHKSLIVTPPSMNTKGPLHNLVTTTWCLWDPTTQHTFSTLNQTTHDTMDA